MPQPQPKPIRMIAGLGNPGEEYASTRHNAGFQTVNELARRAGVTYWKNQLGAEIATTRVRDAEAEGGVREVVLVKPQSFMNTSGGPISKLCREYKVAPEDLPMVHDELDIPEGDVRVKVAADMPATTACVRSSTSSAVAISAASASASESLRQDAHGRFRTQAAAQQGGRGVRRYRPARGRCLRACAHARRGLRP